jgi:hypothetical protein
VDVAFAVTTVVAAAELFDPEGSVPPAVTVALLVTVPFD